MSSSISPFLPPLYLDDGCDVACSRDGLFFPPELLHQCLIRFADYGDLCKLAVVQRQWTTILYDSATTETQRLELAEALLHGKAGLQANPRQALKVLMALASIPVDNNNCPILATTSPSTSNNDDIGTTHSTTNSASRAAAMKEIARCYLTGTGVQDTANAKVGLSWLEAAHRVGCDLEAAFEIARIYEDGQYDVPVDIVEAVAWFQTAADAGHIEAMAELGLCYELGLAVEQSDERALDWYMKAAEKGHLTAKYSIGEAYESARGVPQSDTEACLWYYRAAIDGDEDSRNALRRLEAIARIVLPGVASLLDV